MIRLKRRRSGSAVPAAFRGDKLKRKAEKLIRAFYDAQANDTKIVFDSSEWKAAKNALKKDSAGKCAYCEAPTDVVAHGDVEHFRPKSTYWWLAYCYDNYLFSCQICNQSHKKDKFPISGALAAAVEMPDVAPTGPDLEDLIAEVSLDASALSDADVLAMWLAEDADLINPYLEDPDPLFKYEVDEANGEVWVRSAGGPREDRAMAAADACLGINRETLRRERHNNYRVLAVLREVLEANLNAPARSLATTEVRRLQHQSEPFSGMRRWFAAQWGLPGPE
jgi:uncharacterized protein (TIGR02646 family)